MWAIFLPAAPWAGSGLADGGRARQKRAMTGYFRGNRRRGIHRAGQAVALFAGAIGLGAGGTYVSLRGLPAPLARLAGMAQPAAVTGADRLSARFSRCSGPARDNCVVDGDTFWFQGAKIRVADIDTPETHPPRCPYEAKLGEQATERMQALLNEGPFSLEEGDRDTDRYGRELRVVTRGGQSLGETLVREGLAREWVGYRSPWC